jgi:hypothetical protein
MKINISFIFVHKHLSNFWSCSTNSGNVTCHYSLFINATCYLGNVLTRTSLIAPRTDARDILINTGKLVKGLRGQRAPRVEICPLGGMFTPSFTPRSEISLLFRRMEGPTENFTPRR